MISCEGSKIEMGVNMKRNYSIDLLRIFCCYCIIMLHASAHLDSTGNFWRLVQGVVRPALWCFLSLSGYFILSKPIVKWSEFYFRHLLHLLIPLVFYTFIYQLYYSNGGGYFPFGNFGRGFGRSLMVCI